MESNPILSINKMQKAMLLSGGRVKSNLALKGLLKEISKSRRNPGETINNALLNVAPLFSLKSQKRGKRVVQSPVPIISNEKRIAIASRWLVKNSTKHNQQSFSKRLVAEVKEASLNQGFSKKQQQELNKLVVLNRSAL